VTARDGSAAEGRDEDLAVELRLARFHLARAEQRAEELERQLAALRASRTYRLGRLLVAPLHRARTLRSQLDLRASIGRARARWRPEQRWRSRPPRGPVASVAVEPAPETAARLQRALDRQVPADGSGVVAFAVAATELAAGRGDLYAALGLGEELHARGLAVAYLGPEDWYRPPPATVMLVSMLAEPSLALDPRMVRTDVTLVAWIRNATARWLESPWLGLYDRLWCSSQRSADAVARRVTVPVEVVPLALDPAIFPTGDPSTARTAVVSTVQSWGARGILAALAACGTDAPLALFGRGSNLPRALQRYHAGVLEYTALASVYRQAAAVLDDVQDVNREHGHVNARILDALASGTLPITNGRLGLEELGLERVPVVEDAGELRAVLDRVRDDVPRRTDTVRALQQRVLEDHTWAQRADQLDSSCRSPELPTDRTTLAFAPDYTGTNPYQRLLYGGLARRGVRTVPVSGPGELVASLRPEPRELIYHQHWTATILGPARDEQDRRRLLQTYLDGLDALLDGGAKLVWTVHNVLPHECADPETETALRRELAARASVIHIMCERTLDAVEDRYPLPRDRVRVIGHGSYVGVYPNSVDRTTARRRFGFTDELVFGFIGQIRPYKGLDRLLDAYAEVRPTIGPSALLVAGAPGRSPGIEALLQRCASQPGVHLERGEVPDEELQDVFAAVDVVVLPYLGGLNSGLLHLAQSFRRPVVCPASGCLPEAIDRGAGIVFDADGLAAALRAAASMDLPAAGRLAGRRAASFTAFDMAERFADLVEVLRVDAS
jgi:beta-1,4-mannosyltransferase